MDVTVNHWLDWFDSSIRSHTNSKVYMNNIIGFIGVVSWLAGISIAKGWYAFLAIIFFPYSWYVVVDKLIEVSIQFYS